MDDELKRIIYLAAAMFLCRRPADLEGRPSPADEIAYRESIDNAVELWRRIEARFPNSWQTSIVFRCSVITRRCGQRETRRNC